MLFSGERICIMFIRECISCGKYFGKDSIIVDSELHRIYYCKECYDDKFTTCPNCDRQIEKNELIGGKSYEDGRSTKIVGCGDCLETCDRCDDYIERTYRVYDKDNDQKNYCMKCFENYVNICEECSEDYEHDALQIYNNEYICSNCKNEKLKNEKCEQCGITNFDLEGEGPHEQIEDFYGEKLCGRCKRKNYETPDEHANRQKFLIDPKQNYIDQLKQLVPISVKDIKTKYPKLFANIREIIEFAKGKVITKEIIENYLESQHKFYVDYSGWGFGLQRAIGKRENRQLVLNICVPNLSSKAIEFIQTTHNEEHPFKPNQIGWVRIELNDVEKYILIDEIQSDLEFELNRKRKEINELESVGSEVDLEFKKKYFGAFKINKKISRTCHASGH